MIKYGIRCIAVYGDEDDAPDNHLNEWIDVADADDGTIMMFGTIDECYHRLSLIHHKLRNKYNVFIKSCDHDKDYCHCEVGVSKEELSKVIKDLDL